MAYIGPGDIGGAALCWYGLRAFSAAKAGTKALRIQRASDSTQSDFNTLASGDLDLASITTFLASTTGTVVTIYDQTGSGFDLIQVNGTSSFTFNALGTHPCVTVPQLFSGNSNFQSSSSLTQSQPCTMSLFCTSQTVSGTSNIFGTIGSSNALSIAQFQNNTIISMQDINNGASVIGSATLNSAHAVQAYFNGPSSWLNIDGALTNTGNIGSASLSTAVFLGNNGTSAWSGPFFEAGIWAGNAGYLITNQLNYWTSPVSAPFSSMSNVVRRTRMTVY